MCSGGCIGSDCPSFLGYVFLLPGQEFWIPVLDGIYRNQLVRTDHSGLHGAAGPGYIAGRSKPNSRTVEWKMDLNWLFHLVYNLNWTDLKREPNFNYSVLESVCSNPACAYLKCKWRHSQTVRVFLRLYRISTDMLFSFPISLFVISLLYFP